MKKHIFLIGYTICFTFLGCANNNIKSTEEKKDTKIDSNIVTVSDNISYNTLELVPIDTGEYKIEYVLYKDILRENPEYTSEWKKIDGLNRDGVHSIKFIQRSTNKVVRVYDLEKESPYANLPLKTISRENDAGINYVIEGNNPIRFKAKKLNYVSDYNAKYVTTYCQAENLHRVTDKEHIAIGYCAEFYNKSNKLIGITSEVHIMNNQGKIVHKLKGIDTEIDYLSTTEDGLYIVFSRGGLLNEKEETLDNDGIDIYDVLKNKKIINIESIKDFTTSIPSVNGNSIFVSLDKTDASIYRYQIYRPKENVMYSKDFGRDELGKCEMTYELEYKIINPKTKERTSIKFEKDFLTSKIFEK
jgi:hypothetical protein